MAPSNLVTITADIDMAKQHTDNGKGKGLCGANIPEEFNPWTSSLETCLRCASIAESLKNKRIIESLKSK